MTDRIESIDHFELVRWARRQAEEHDLTQLEAHLLLLLATYANSRAIAWPSIRTLAKHVGLKVRERERGSGNRAVERALGRLHELGLIWRRQTGRRPATTKLLFVPPEETGQEASAPSVETRAPSVDTGRSTSSEEPVLKNQMTPRPNGRGRSSPEEVKAIIRESLDGT